MRYSTPGLFFLQGMTSLLIFHAMEETCGQKELQITLKYKISWLDVYILPGEQDEKMQNRTLCTIFNVAVNWHV